MFTNGACIATANFSTANCRIGIFAEYIYANAASAIGVAAASSLVAVNAVGTASTIALPNLAATAGLAFTDGSLAGLLDLIAIACIGMAAVAVDDVAGQHSFLELTKPAPVVSLTTIVGLATRIAHEAPCFAILADAMHRLVVEGAHRLAAGRSC